MTDDTRNALMSVEDIARTTGRSPEMIRRYARKGLIESVPDPEDKRRILIPLWEVLTIGKQPRIKGSNAKQTRPRSVGDTTVDQLAD